MLTSASRSVRTLFLLVLSTLFFGLVVPIAPASAAPATVTVTISGTAAVGSTLTANVTLNPSTGGVKIDSYKWQSVDGANAPVDIPGASGGPGTTTVQPYVPTADMIGKKIQVVVTSTGSSNGSTQPGTGTSPQTAAVVAGTFTSAGTVTISDTTPQVDQTVTANVTGTNPSAGVTYAYQWYTVTGGGPEVLVAGATNQTFTAADTDLGKKLLVKVIASKTGYNNSNEVSSAQTTAVAAATFTTPPSVAISDTTPQVDQTVTANVTGTSPSAGVTYAYQWYNIPSGNTQVLIAGATTSTYTADAGDLGKKLLVKVIASKSGYTNSAEVSSVATTAVAAADFSTPPTVAIDDTTPEIGQTLTATGTDAVPSSGTTYSYQWFTVSGANPAVAIGGATQSTYQVAPGDADKKILVKKTAAKAGYTSSTATSAETSVVPRLDFTTGPTVTIDDTSPVVDDVLTATASGEVPASSSYTYQWYTVNGTDPEVAISGATHATYTVQPATVGSTIFVRVHAVKVGYNDAIGNSAQTDAVIKANFTTPPSVAISDTTPQVDQTVTANVTGTVPSAGVTYAYQWYTVDGGGPEVLINGETGSTYTVVAGDLDKKLLVKVVASKAGYNSTAEVSSDLTTAVASGDFTTPPTVTIDDTTPTVDQTLTAGGTDAVPSAGTTYAFQWYTVDGADPAAAIDGATESTYKVVAADVGKKILVKKTASKTAYTSSTATSAETSAVVKADFTTDPTVTIDDTNPVVDEVLTATASGEVPASSSYTYQWYTVNGSDPEMAISGATQSTYTVEPATVGSTIFVRVHANKAGYNDGIGNSDATDAVAKADFSPGPEVSVSDSTPQVDQEVSAVLDTDAVPAGSYTYQWYTVDGANPAVEISGATDDTYTVAVGDLGLKLQVKVTASKTGYNDASDTSDETSAVAKADFSTGPEVSVSDSTPQVDQEVSAVLDTDAVPAGSYTYQWYTVDGGNPAVEISGATDDKYTVTAGDEGLALKVRVTASKTGYNDASDTSGATSAVAKADFTTGPTVTIDDTTPVVDEELTATASGEVPSSDSYTYQWYTVHGDDDPVAISGATQSTYTVEPEAVGDTIFVRVHAKKAGYNDAIGNSDETDIVLGLDFTSGPQVSIDDLTPTVGDEVSAVLDTASVPSADSYAYQWYTVAGSDPAVKITGATDDAYTVAADDAGLALKVRVTASKTGYNDASDTSDPTSVVAKRDFTTPPTATITGTPKVGVQLTANASGESPAGSGYTYQWKADGTDIASATSSTFTPGATEVGKTITVAVRATKAGYNPSAVGTSDPTSAVAKADFTTDPTASITGTAKVDSLLTAHASGESPAGTGYTYQWKAGGTDIPSATSSTFTPGATEVGKTITVTVAATKAGYNPSGADTSDPTAAVVKADFTGTLTVLISDTTPTEGQLLTANPSGESPAGTYAYQWKADGTDISGATSSTFTPGATEVNKALTVTVTATKAGYNDASGTSSATTAVAPATLSNFTTGPTANLSSTTPKVGDTLTANPTGEVPTADSYNYQWYRISALGVKSAMVGEFAKTYVVTPGNLNYKLQVKVTAVKAGFNNRSASSVQTNPVNQITLSKSTVARGSTLTVIAKYLRAGQVYRIFIDGVTVYKGTVPSNGTASRTVTVPTSIGTGSKRVWVSGYTKSGVRDFQVLTSIPVT